jgi:membrane protein implicated in regulation of membrane protease activity
MNAHDVWWSLAVMVATTEVFFGALYFVAGGFALFCGGMAARFGAGLPMQFLVAVGVYGLIFATLRRRDRRGRAQAPRTGQ